MKKFVVFNSEYASGARLVGRKLAEDLGIKFYGEKELLKIASEEYKLDSEILREFDNEIYYADEEKMSSEDRNELEKKILRVSEIYENIILRLLNEGPCLFMERGSDIILKDREDVLNVYAYSSNLDEKIERCFAVEGIPKNEAVEHIEIEKVKREKYYNLVYHTERKHMRDYALCIDTDSFGIEKCADIIKAAL